MIGRIGLIGPGIGLIELEERKIGRKEERNNGRKEDRKIGR